MIEKKFDIEYRLVFPDKNRNPTFMNCYLDKFDFRFLRKDGEIYEFFHHGSLSSIYGVEKIKDDFKLGDLKVDFSSRIDIKDTRSFPSLVESVFEEYRFFKELKNEVIDRGWYDLYQIDKPRLLHDKKVEMPENLYKILTTISEYNPEERFKVGRN